jgi:hypothetical protein
MAGKQANALKKADMFPYHAPLCVVKSSEAGLISLVVVGVMLAVLVQDFTALVNGDVTTDRRAVEAMEKPPALPPMALVVQKYDPTRRSKELFFDPEFVKVRAAHVTFSGLKKDKKKARFALEQCQVEAGDYVREALCPPKAITPTLATTGKFEDSLFQYTEVEIGPCTPQAVRRVRATPLPCMKPGSSRASKLTSHCGLTSTPPSRRKSG